MPGCSKLREIRLRQLLRTTRARKSPSLAGLLLLAGNAVALLLPALLVGELTLIYTLSASYHETAGFCCFTTVAHRCRRSPRSFGFIVPGGPIQDRDHGSMRRGVW